MPDEADLGNERMEKWLEAQISEHQYRLNQMGNEPEESVCSNCKEPLPAGQRYCSKDCLQDWEDRLAADRRNGKYRGG